MHSIKILFTYVQLILYRYRISCIYTFSFIVGVLGYTPNTHLWYELSGRQHPNLRAVITALAKEKNNRYALYNQNKAWELPDFITIYTHPNEYIAGLSHF
ncbi:hypothetical protein [Cardinium endosymbiont of Culicoides punctatus]|uniref:hypothetical protein n=1 Tax=Cardinium endosymbiont of Culicoides punctatus TaxID=2304601 RepID=UPI0010583BD6|nr:hypothetical protein [Cardinium endosymbiont of Culicoides punctatus]TDG95447.1 hypothetical protein CCPUN_03410 [Cardinium endosymbiont of Culicoides punctatus]